MVFDFNDVLNMYYRVHYKQKKFMQKVFMNVWTGHHGLSH